MMSLGEFLDPLRRLHDWIVGLLFLFAIWAASVLSYPARAAEPQLVELNGDLTVHDPAIIKEGGTYFLFCTGGNRGQGIVPIRTSPDLRQ